jgi:hypothetical protein
VADIDVNEMLRRRRNTDVPIDDPAIFDVDKRVSVVRQKLLLRHEAGTTGSASD